MIKPRIIEKALFVLPVSLISLSIVLTILLTIEIKRLDLFHQKITAASKQIKLTSPIKVALLEDDSMTKMLTFNQPIYGLKIKADISLKNDQSLIRVILIDNNKNEYLVYEAYPLITEDNFFAVSEACEETCLLNNVDPVSIRIEGNNSEINIKDFFLLTSSSLELGSEKEKIKKEIENQKIKRMNEILKFRGLKWEAGETSVSKLSYQQKKRLFSTLGNQPLDRLPNLYGFEYYISGIFELPSNTPTGSFNQTKLPVNLPQKWDWRNVHGENWNTPVRNQGLAGNCWAFATIGAMESLLNLYYNQHLDFDLSEQMLVDCFNYPELPMGMNSAAYAQCSGQNQCYPGAEYCIIGQHGIADEYCDPYDQRGLEPPHCDENYICHDWQDRAWKITDFEDFKLTPQRGIPACPRQTRLYHEDELKRRLIRNGPMSCDYLPLAHRMVLTGYEIDPSDQKTIWIYKNSWGEEWGEQGYAKIKTSIEKMGYCSLPFSPIVPPPNTILDIACEDKDNDGYCNWGISQNKPDSCPSSCQPQKDCNDADPIEGPFDENLYCLPIMKINRCYLSCNPLIENNLCGKNLICGQVPCQGGKPCLKRNVCYNPDCPTDRSCRCLLPSPSQP